MTAGDLVKEMISYYEGDPKRIQHFLKVYAYAKIIGEGEGLNEETQDILQLQTQRKGIQVWSSITVL